MKTATQEEVASVFDRAETELSFWGARKVHIEGFEGSVKLWNVIKKYRPEDNLAVNLSRKYEADNTRHKIAQKIIKLVSDSQRQEEKLHWITRVFLCIRESFGFSMNLSTFIKTFDEVEVANLLERAETKISFWGARKVYVDGFEGSVKLWNVIRKYKPEEFRVSSSCKYEEDNPYHRIARKITKLVSDSQRQEKELRWITHVFVFLREGPEIKPFDIYSQTECFHIPNKSWNESNKKK